MRIERRLTQPRWLTVAVPVGSLAFAFGAMAVVLAATGHDPGHTYRRLVQAGFIDSGALSGTFAFATPLLFTGLAAAAAFRMRLFNIGGEGQLYVGAIFAAYTSLYLRSWPSPLLIAAMVAAGCAGGALWASIPGVFKAFLSTNEIVTSLMLNYVAAYYANYLIFGSHSYLRDTTSPSAQVFPLGKDLPNAASWPGATVHAAGGILLPLGFGIGVLAAALLWGLYSRTRFGFEARVIADSSRAARYAGMRTRRKILAVMAISGAVAGLGGASQDGDFRHQFDPKYLTDPHTAYGYAGIVVAALARYNPFAVVLVAFLLGGLQNAGYTLQGADFPSGLVGVMQGMILFSALGGELLVRYRFTFRRRTKETGVAAPEPAA